MPKLKKGIDDAKNSTKKYLLMKIKDRQYGIDIGYVENVVRVPSITRVPKSQDYFKGIINLRGEIIAVMSLCLRMKQGNDVFTDDSRIVIINLGVLGNVGILADQVNGMVQMQEDEIDFQIKPAEDNRQDFISGIGRFENKSVFLLDINAVVYEKEYNKYGGNEWENLH